ncbi:uncharacterized protein LOC143034553 [Oratosquilla oratoria]|uniref:uncharacterized protein LOC143034553 n=1 Tax=Oratosquilla oratoria TaxID=337810 RepID=UPI003F7635D2
MNKLIGVIGAGASGLNAAHHITAKGMVPIVWEQSNKVGGTWVYTPSTGKNEYGLPIHSSMYENLRTNIPKEIMAFPDFPFKEEEDSFVMHTSVLQYLQDYANHFNIYPDIKFKSHVEKVIPVIKEDGPPAWNVSVKDLDTQECTTTVCDAIFVCIGQFSVPKTPQIPGIENYKGGQLHSHDYRTPYCYKDLCVVILGAAASGLDISLEIASVAKEVILSHNYPVPIPSELPPNLKQVRGVVEATEKGFIMADGEKYNADAIVYCTGYEYTFPFLDESCGITVKNNQVMPLYKHIINSTHPSMGFIGIPFQVCPFPTFDIQVQYFLSVITGKVQLPSSPDMLAWLEKDLQVRQKNGWERRHYHCLRVDQWEYCKDLAKEAGAPQPSPVLKYIFELLWDRRLLALTEYKKLNYKIHSTEVEEILEGKRVNTTLDMMSLKVWAVSKLLWNNFPQVFSAVYKTVIFKLRKFM